MAVGWAGDSAVLDQINDSISDAVAKARRELPQGGESLLYCQECGDEIPKARREALPGVRLCVECQSDNEKKSARDLALYNRRGSKDSQLR